MMDCSKQQRRGGKSYWVILLTLIYAVTLLALRNLRMDFARDKKASSVADKQEHDAVAHKDKSKPQYKIILGVSTGHAGSTTAHNTLSRECAPLNFSRFRLERTNVKDERSWTFRSRQETCTRVSTTLVPHLHKLAAANNKTLLDLGHFHNRNIAVLECLADFLGDEAIFVRIRRNRHDVATSFSTSKLTPCLTAPHLRPSVSVCPHSLEVAQAGPVYLNVSDKVWDSFTPFQKFLWYADEVEERWHVLTNKKREAKSPQFYEITWSNADQLENGIRQVQASLGCAMNHEMKLNNDKKHVRHIAGRRNCSDLIQQDLEYRRLMKYSKQQTQHLFDAWPQHVDSPDCKDTYDELLAAIQQYSDKVNLDSWVLPNQTR